MRTANEAAFKANDAAIRECELVERERRIHEDADTAKRALVSKKTTQCMGFAAVAPLRGVSI